MLISTNWLSDFVDLKGVNLKELINRFTLSTAEVEEIYEYGKNIENVVAAKIVSVENHENSKKLHILMVDDGEKTVQVICGAPNVREGMIVAFARAGGMVCGQKIEVCKVAGVESFGMCCSEKELGISDEHGGIMDLPADTVLGTSIKELFPIDDVVFEVDNKSLTNRPDLWGHYGIAREVSALIDRPLKPIELFDTSVADNLPKVDICVEDKEKCFRYSGITIKNITKKSAPMEMKIRLFYCGMRSLNLLADLTNYLMLELGQPMHAFDNNIVSKISVRSVSSKFTFKTLDDVEREIPENTLMICQGENPVAIAGIMGGNNSSISDDTTSVLLESASFDGVCVRKTATKIGLRTEASARYEKALDPELTMVALKRFVKLLKDIDNGAEITSSVTDLYVRKYPVIKFEIEKAFIDKYTGIEISNETILKTLKALDFKVELNNDVFAIEVPSFRATKDISLKADMIEEITRIYGYDNFELKTTKTPLVPVRQNPIHEEEYNAKLLLSQAAHCNEVHSYIWYNDKVNSELGIKTKDNVRILNSVSPDHSMIREFIMPSLINFAYQNKQSEISIFEIGRVAKGFRQDKTCDEKKVLGILVGSKTLSEKQVFYKAKSILENLSVTLKNIKPTYDKIKEEQGFIHPYNSLSVYFNGNYGGYISTLHPIVKENLDKKLNVAMVEIEFNALVSCQRGEFVFADVSKYPGIDIDLSLSVDMDVEYKQLENIISEYKNEHLSKVSLVDIYTDDSMQNKKSVTLRFAFLSMERTLCGDEVNSYTNELIKLFEKYNITLR